MEFYDILVLNNTKMQQPQWGKEQGQEEDRKRRKRNKKKTRKERRKINDKKKKKKGIAQFLKDHLENIAYFSFPSTLSKNSDARNRTTHDTKEQKLRISH